MSFEWKKVHLAELNPNRVELNIYVEGYRPTKEVWLYSTETFDDIERAIDRYNELYAYPCPLEFDQVGTTLEDIEILEYDANGNVYKWTKEYKETD